LSFSVRVSPARPIKQVSFTFWSHMRKLLFLTYMLNLLVMSHKPRVSYLFENDFHNWMNIFYRMQDFALLFSVLGFELRAIQGPSLEPPARLSMVCLLLLSQSVSSVEL
jgi:hypothetical protein